MWIVAAFGVQGCMELRVDSIADTVGFIERMPLPPGLDRSVYQADLVRQPRQLNQRLPSPAAMNSS